MPKVGYVVNEHLGYFQMPRDFSMHPKRVAMTDSLIKSYEMGSKLEGYIAKPASLEDMAQFHSRAYLEYLSRWSLPNPNIIVQNWVQNFQKSNMKGKKAKQKNKQKQVQKKRQELQSTQKLINTKVVALSNKTRKQAYGSDKSHKNLIKSRSNIPQTGRSTRKHKKINAKQQQKQKSINLSESSSGQEQQEQQIEISNKNVNKLVKNKHTQEIQDLGQQYLVGLDTDCPVFEGMFDYCKMVIGGSLDAARLLISGRVQTAINWAGGHHHAKKQQGAGFCYVNDVVLCILQLLKVYPRVLYLDLDIHHADGVQQAFLSTNRVMTVSFHQYDQNFYPGTGSSQVIGNGIGKYYCLNVPIQQGIDDNCYYYLFRSIIPQVMGCYCPDVVVMQCGADTIAGDKLGQFNMTVQGHVDCISLVKSYGLPTILLGGGGYSKTNVAKCWVKDTAIMCGIHLPNQIPPNDLYYDLYLDKTLNSKPKSMINQNKKVNMDRLIGKIRENIRQIQFRPSVCFHYAPRKYLPYIESKQVIQPDDGQSIQITDFQPLK